MLQKVWLAPTYAARGTLNNCHIDGDEEDEKSIVYVEDNSESEKGKLYFTLDQHKSLLALLQKSSSMQSHSVNQVITKTSKNTSIICAITSLPNSNNTFILDT